MTIAEYRKFSPSYEKSWHIFTRYLVTHPSGGVVVNQIDFDHSLNIKGFHLPPFLHSSLNSSCDNSAFLPGFLRFFCSYRLLLPPLGYYSNCVLHHLFICHLEWGVKYYQIHYTLYFFIVEKKMGCLQLHSSAGRLNQSCLINFTRRDVGGATVLEPDA